jgi:hypothetical protein
VIGTVLLWGPVDFADRIRTGDVVSDLLRPVDPVCRRSPVTWDGPGTPPSPASSHHWSSAPSPSTSSSPAGPSPIRSSRSRGCGMGGWRDGRCGCIGPGLADFRPRSYGSC